MDDAQKVSIHEAGHFVAACRLKKESGIVTILPAEGSLGHVLHHGFDSASAVPEKEVLFACAGYAALIAAGCSEADAREGCEGTEGSDFATANEIIAGYSLGTLEYWLTKAIAMMSQDANKNAVTLVAQHLLQHKRLGPDYCEVLVDLSDGEISLQEWEEYLMTRQHMGYTPADL